MTQKGREATRVGAAPAWFDVQDLAQRYQMSVRQVFRLADNGRLPWGTKLGALRRWSRQSIEEWEAGGCQPVRLGATPT